MGIGMLYLESISTGIITGAELDWIATNQMNFSRCEKVTALKIERLVNAGKIQLGCKR